MQLDVATVLLQWSTGGLLCLWVTTRRRQVGLGYGWLLRAIYGLLAAGAIAVGLTSDDTGTGATLRDAGSAGAALAAALALFFSITRRSAGVSGQEAERTRRRQRVATMLDAASEASRSTGDRPRSDYERAQRDHTERGGGLTGAAARRSAKGTSEFNPTLDLVGPAVGLIGILGAAAVAGGPYGLSAVRLVTGAALLGVASDAMLLGHWYLVQPGLPRAPIRELVKVLAWAWSLEVAAFLWPTGMVQVLTGAIDDGWGGLLGWMWLLSALTTIALAVLTWFALEERSYSAVMAATGLLYLTILTAFGTDLVARAVLA